MGLLMSEKFRGKFQRACQSSAHWWRVNAFFPGYIRAEHCDCESCTEDRKEYGYIRCSKDNRCLYCMRKELADRFGSV